MRLSERYHRRTPQRMPRWHVLREPLRSLRSPHGRRGGTPQVSIGTTPPAGGSGDIPAAPGGITEEHNFRAQVHELTQLLGTVTEALQHYDAERARETEKLTAAMRTLGEALAAAVRRTQSHDVGVALQSVEQKLDRVIGLLQKGGSGGS